MPRNRSLSDRPRCAHCDEVIGAYERFVEMIGGTIARETSRAAEPDALRAPGAAWYHMACYKARENPVREAP